VPDPLAGRLAACVLQRKIGIEIETALPASRHVPGEDVLTDRSARQALRNQLVADVDGRYRDRERVWAKTRMHEGTGWYATADNTDRLGEGSGANVELVTDPPIATGRDLEAEVRTVVEHVESMRQWASGFAATAGTQRTRVGTEYAIGFPSVNQVKELKKPDPPPTFAPGVNLAGWVADVEWSTTGACKLTLSGGAGQARVEVTLTQHPSKPLDIQGVRGPKRTKINAIKVKEALGAPGMNDATDGSRTRSARSPTRRLPRTLPRTTGRARTSTATCR
jgi:hypothetical protein